MQDWKIVQLHVYAQGIASRNIDYKGGVGVDIFVLIGGGQ